MLRGSLPRRLRSRLAKSLEPDGRVLSEDIVLRGHQDYCLDADYSRRQRGEQSFPAERWVKVAHRMRRRDFLRNSIMVGASTLAGKCGGSSRWQAGAFRKAGSSRVAILRAASYEDDLTQVVLDGIKVCGLSVAGKTVLLKPN